MQENSELIKEINALRKRVQGSIAGDSLSASQSVEAALKLELTSQRVSVERLTEELRLKENRIRELERSVISRPVSREQLPPHT